MRELEEEKGRAGLGGRMKMPAQYDGVMRIDLLKRWLKMFPYGYCDGMNYQTCRATEHDCPYCQSGVNCSDGHAALNYYREVLSYRRLGPKKAAKAAIGFAECLPSILRSLDAEIEKNKRKENDDA